MKYWRGKKYIMNVGERKFLLAEYGDQCRCDSKLDSTSYTMFTLFSRSAKQMRLMIENRFLKIEPNPRWICRSYVCVDVVIASVVIELFGKRFLASVYCTPSKSEWFDTEKEAKSFVENYIGGNDARQT